MQIAAQARQKVIGLAQLGTGVGGAVAQLSEPADQLVIAQAAGRLLDVRLQVVERGGVLGVAVARQLREIAHQGVAVAVDEARQAVGQPGVERPVAGEKALIQQADVQFDIVVVHLGAFVRRAHRVADAQAGVPKMLQERRDRLLGARHLPFGGNSSSRSMSEYGKSCRRP